MLKLKKVIGICSLGLCIVMTAGGNSNTKGASLEETQAQAEEMTKTNTMEDKSESSLIDTYKQYEEFGMKYNESDNRFTITES